MNPKRNKSNRPRSKADFYETPFELARGTIELLYAGRLINPRNIYGVLDPGCGNGVWTDEYIRFGKSIHQFPTAYVGVDIDEPKHNKFLYSNLIIDDFISHDFGGEVFDLILGNPPFSLMEEFVNKSLSLLNEHGTIAFLGRLEFLGSQKRAKRLFLNTPPFAVWVSSRRPSFFSVLEGKHTTDMMEYAIFIWKKNFIGNTKLDWLMWEYEK